jgi:hypothetical protein
VCIALYTLQANLYAYAFTRLPRSTGGEEHIVGTMNLVYGVPDRSKAYVYPCPVIPDGVLERIMDVLLGYVTSVKKHASEGAGRNLIHCIWSNPVDVAEFARSPSFASCDVKCCTNALHRPLQILVGKRASGSTIQPMLGFLSDESNSAFRFWFEVAMPHIIGRETMGCINIVVCDENARQIEAFEHARDVTFRFHSRCLLRSCGVHKIVRALRLNENFGFNNVNRGIYNKIKQCLVAVNRELATVKEATMALAALRSYAKQVLSASKAALLEGFLDKLERNLDSWAFYRVIFLNILGEFTSNRVEGFNALFATAKHLKRTGLTKKSQLVDTVDLQRAIHLQRDVRDHLRRTMLLNNTPTREISEVNKLCGPEVDALVLQQLEQWKRYTVRPWEHAGCFVVKLEGDHLQQSCAKALNARKIEPTFFHTRLVWVHVSEDGRYLYLQCNCGHYQRDMVACRHIYAVKQGHVEPLTDIHPTLRINFDLGLIDMPRKFNDNQTTGPVLDGVDASELRRIQVVSERSSVLHVSAWWAGIGRGQ